MRKVCEDLAGHAFEPLHHGFILTAWEDKPAVLRVSCCGECGQYQVARFNPDTFEPLHPPQLVSVELPADVAELLAKAFPVPQTQPTKPTINHEHAAVNRYIRKGKVFVVVLDLNCTSVGGLTAGGLHRELDRCILDIPGVTSCKQHGWINEEDDSAELDVWTTLPRAWGWLPWVQARKANKLRGEVEMIMSDLLSH